MSQNHSERRLTVHVTQDDDIDLANIGVTPDIGHALTCPALPNHYGTSEDSENAAFLFEVVLVVVL